MAIIKVPKTPTRAFNPDRRASALLRSQIEHLEWAVRPAAERLPGTLKIRLPRTEGQAAARIARLTRELHPAGAIPVEVPAPPARRPRRRKRGKPKRKTKRQTKRRTRRAPARAAARKTARAARSKKPRRTRRRKKSR